MWIGPFFDGIRYSQGADFAQTSGHLSDYGRRSHGLYKKILVNERPGVKGEYEEMQLREYIPSDVDQLAELFHQTVHSVNGKEYSTEQLHAWANGKVDLQEWNRSFLEHYTIVAVENDRIVGFGDIDRSGYLDRLYVHKDHQRKGIASAICDRLEQQAGKQIITTHASITARPFFERRGYRVIRRQKVVRCGIELTNYVMEK